MAQNQTISTAEKFYNRYEYLANKYASKIFNYEALSFEYEDLIQEFRLKIFEAVKAYGRRWNKYRQGCTPRPVPIKYYLEAACSNKGRDFMKYITREGYKVRIDDIDFDFGVELDTEITPEENRFILNGVDLLEGLESEDRAVFSMFLRGYQINFLAKVYNNGNTKEPKTKKVRDLIEKQKEYLLAEYGNSLIEVKEIYFTYSIGEE